MVVISITHYIVNHSGVVESSALKLPENFNHSSDCRKRTEGCSCATGSSGSSNRGLRQRLPTADWSVGRANDVT